MPDPLYRVRTRTAYFLLHCLLLIAVLLLTRTASGFEANRPGSNEVAISPRSFSVVRVDSCESSEVSVERDLEYKQADGRALRLDLYLPERATEARPAVVLVHGELGDGRRGFECFGNALAGFGFAAAVIEYRTPVERTFPAGLEDFLDAVRWLRRNGADYRIETLSVGAAGRGFGGYLVALAGLTAPDEVNAIAALHARMDLTRGAPPWMYPYRHHAFLGFSFAERPDLWRLASPVDRVGPDSPPLLLLHGTEDASVSFEEATSMRDAVDSSGGYVRLVGVENASNGYFDEGPGFEQAVDELSRFFGQFLLATSRPIEIRRGIVYARPDGRELRLDLFLPQNSNELMPAVILLHGGGWMWGNKRDMWREAADLATHGFVAATVEYRLSRERRYPAAVDDVKAAVRWLRAHAQEFGIHPNRIGAAGSSAGGHLAALLGVTPDMKHFGQLYGPTDPSAAVQAVVLISGVVDMQALFPREPLAAATFLGYSPSQAPELYAEASPLTYVGPHAAAFLAVHGTEDHLGSHAEVVEMARALRSYGVRAEVHSIEKGEHDFWSDEAQRSEGMQAIIAFLSEALQHIGPER